MGKLFDRALSAYSHADIDRQLKARFFLVLCIVILATILVLTFLAGIIQHLNVGDMVNSVIATLLLSTVCVLVVLWLLVRGYFLLASHLLIVIIMTAVWIVMVVDPGEPVARLDSFVYIISLLGLLPLVIHRRTSVIALYGLINLIIRQHSGFIRVYSEPGQGTTFKIYFPEVEGQAVAEDLKSPAGSLIPGGTETVLMVEDDPAILKFGVTVLEQLGYNLLAADSPEKALALAQSGGQAIDLLLTDVVMPEMSGHELAGCIRETIPTVRCLYISGYTANAISNGDLIEKKICFLAKPFSIRELAEKVREALS